MSYRYKARDSLGKTHEGVVDVDDRDEAMQSLQRDGFSVVTMEEEEGSSFMERGIKKSEIIYATGQLAIMVETGISLATALDGLMQQEQNPTLKKVLADLKNRVEGGEDFSIALARYPKYFDRTFVSMVRASEQTGTLGTMLDRISSYLRTDLETRGKVMGAMAYPGVMMFIAIGITIFLLVFIMPKFTPLFSRQGMKLPVTTQAMMWLSGSMLKYWYVWIGGSIASLVGLGYYCSTPNGRKVVDFVKINIPVLGGLFRKLILSRSVRTLGTMLESGVSAIDALKLTAESSGNYYYEQAWLRVIDQVTQGRKICDVLESDPLFPSTLVQMISSGEETGKLDRVLSKIGSYYDRELELTIKTTTSLLEPIMIVVMGVVVGGIAMSLMLPIFQLARPGGKH